MKTYLLDIITYHIPIKENLFRYLKPSEISSLCVSLGLHLNRYEKRKYMNPINEIFIIDSILSSDNKSDILIIGDNIRDIIRYDKSASFYIYVPNTKRPGSSTYINAMYILPHMYIDIQHEQQDYVGGHYTCTGKNIIFQLCMVPKAEYDYSMPGDISTICKDVLRIIELWKSDNYMEGTIYNCTIPCYISDTNGQRYEDLTLNIKSVLHTLYDLDIHILKIVDIQPRINVTEPLKDLWITSHETEREDWVDFH